MGLLLVCLHTVIFFFQKSIQTLFITHIFHGLRQVSSYFPLQLLGSLQAETQPHHSSCIQQAPNDGLNKRVAADGHQYCVASLGSTLPSEWLPEGTPRAGTDGILGKEGLVLGAHRSCPAFVCGRQTRRISAHTYSASRQVTQNLRTVVSQPRHLSPVTSVPVLPPTSTQTGTTPVSHTMPGLSVWDPCTVAGARTGSLGLLAIQLTLTSSEFTGPPLSTAFEAMIQGEEKATLGQVQDSTSGINVSGLPKSRHTSGPRELTPVGIAREKRPIGKAACAEPGPLCAVSNSITEHPLCAMPKDRDTWGWRAGSSVS